MHLPQFYTENTENREPSRQWRIADLLLIAFVMVLLIGLRARGPSNTYSYAQFWQIRASIDHMNGGSYILPKITAEGSVARKPQLYAWMLTPVLKLTGVYNDFTFRIPSIVSAFGLVLLIYLLGVRWYNRTVGLMAAIFWATAMHMNKLIYLTTTDMLLAFWIGMCVFTLDRVLFHRPSRGRWVWMIAFWISMIFAGLAKSWGIVNLAIIGGLVAFASAISPGFAVLRRVDGVTKFTLAFRLIMRRLGKAILLTGAWWGIPLMLTFFVLLFWAMLHIGGPEFQATFEREVTNRFLGKGVHKPNGLRVPGIIQLYYNTLPMSIFAGCAFFIIPIRRWLKFNSPTVLPLWWIIVVLIAFGVPRGFRPDYLMPCYPAIAILAAWVVDNILKSQFTARPLAKHLRRICFSVPFVIGVGLIVAGGLYIAEAMFPEVLSFVKQPARMSSETWYVIGALPGLGLIAILLSSIAVKTRNMQRIAIITCFCMVGVIFLYADLWSRAARSGDGDTMVKFSQAIKPLVGSEKFLVCRADKLGPEVYIGRMEPSIHNSLPLTTPQHPKWLIISDRGLVHLGAFKLDEYGPGTTYQKGKKIRFVPSPQDLGIVRIRSDAPIQYEYWGRLYLIELTGDIHPTSKPIPDEYIEDEFH
ncbi:MAG: glycosyltransferase family 39 protein [Phycisphaerae bacterium]|nr:glycosyltransferase family 39 protein [Phycisphaerae bacterium]